MQQQQHRRSHSFTNALVLLFFNMYRHVACWRLGLYTNTIKNDESWVRGKREKTINETLILCRIVVILFSNFLAAVVQSLKNYSQFLNGKFHNLAVVSLDWLVFKLLYNPLAICIRNIMGANCFY